MRARFVNAPTRRFYACGRLNRNVSEVLEENHFVMCERCSFAFESVNLRVYDLKDLLNC